MSESVSVLMNGFEFCLCRGEQKVARKHQVAAIGKKNKNKKTRLKESCSRKTWLEVKGR